MKKRWISALISCAMAGVLLVGAPVCVMAEGEEEKTDIASAVPETLEEIPEAAAADVEAFMSDTDEKTVLVDARPQECYAGWALEGAKNGGHLKNAALFSARWLDCEIKDARTVYLTKALKDQKIDAADKVIVYDYTGEQANIVANYFKGQGVKDVAIFKANEMIDAGKDLVSYENYDRFLPTEIVKSVSDVKSGKAAELSEEAKAIFPDGLDKVVLVDVSWGNARTSAYFTEGHVPGAVHINTDCYERPRVYVPEKRSEYAKEWRLIPLEEFRDSVCTQYGITKDSTVIVTGPGTAPLGRLSFMLRSVGVKVYVMTGTLKAWKYNGYELDTDPSTLVIPESVDDFGSDEIANPDEIIWNDTIEKILSGEVDGTVADNRGDDEWGGKYSGYSYHDLAGHVDGAVKCTQDTDGSQNFSNADDTARTQEEIVGYMASCGVDANKLTAFYCGDSWGAAYIAYWCQSVDLNNIKEWGTGWIPWSNEGHPFIDSQGRLVHYDKYLDTVLDENGNDVRDGLNILDDAEN